MIPGLRPYQVYRPFPGPLMPSMPAHWQVVRLKSILRERSEKGYPAEPLLAATQSMGVVRKDRYETRTVTAQKDLHLLKLVRVGDFVISLRSFQGGIEFARDQGIISPAYTVLRAVPSENHRYLGYLFKSQPFVESLRLYVTGIREGQNIDYPKLSRSEIPLPPPAEQVLIARFLDHADRRIRRYIRAKQQLIKLLEEQKQAIIHQAVTRGLDPNVPMQDSGVPWLGRVPAAWSLRRLWTLARVRRERNTGELGLLSVFLDRGVIPYAEGGGQVHAPSLDLSGYQVVWPGDLVLNNQQAWRGSVGVSAHHGIISPAYVVLTLSEDLDSGFANYLFRSRVMVDQFVVASRGVGDIQRQAYWPHLRSVFVPVPGLEEQRHIVRHIEVETGELSRTSEVVRREVELVRELWTRLAADVVSGQLDVRATAVALPDESEDNEAIDDIEESFTEVRENIGNASHEVGA